MQSKEDIEEIDLALLHTEMITQGLVLFLLVCYAIYVISFALGST